MQEKYSILIPLTNVVTNESSSLMSDAKPTSNIQTTQTEPQPSAGMFVGKVHNALGYANLCILSL